MRVSKMIQWIDACCSPDGAVRTCCLCNPAARPTVRTCCLLDGAVLLPTRQCRTAALTVQSCCPPNGADLLPARWCNPAALSSIARTHIKVERKKQLHKAVLWSLHMCHGTHNMLISHTYIHTYTHMTTAIIIKSILKQIIGLVRWLSK